jgi:hypothetical protein
MSLEISTASDHIASTNDLIEPCYAIMPVQLMNFERLDRLIEPDCSLVTKKRRQRVKISMPSTDWPAFEQGRCDSCQGRNAGVATVREVN